MKRLIVLTLVVIAGLGSLPATAAEQKTVTPMWYYGAPADTPPFARSERAQAVWNSGACWSECGSYCAWGLAGCLQQDAQGRCLKLTNACDRYCQRECRTGAGPFLGPLLGLTDW